MSRQLCHVNLALAMNSKHQTIEGQNISIIVNIMHRIYEASSFQCVADIAILSLAGAAVWPAVLSTWWRLARRCTEPIVSTS